MNNDELRAEIKTELNRHTFSSKLRAELLNRCYVALGEQQVQEGQYDDELHEAWQSRLIGLIKSYRAADDGSEVRDVFRAITAHIEVQPMSMTMLPAEAQAGLALQRNEIDRLKQQLRAEGDRIAELRTCLEFIYPFVKGKTVSNRRAAQGPIYTINIGAEIEKVLGGDL